MTLKQNKKQNFLKDLRSSGEAVTYLFEVTKHVAFLYMKPGCLELWVASRDNSECINYCKMHKVTQILEKRAFEQDCSTFANTLKTCARTFEQRLNFAPISKIRRSICYPFCYIYRTIFNSNSNVPFFKNRITMMEPQQKVMGVRSQASNV